VIPPPRSLPWNSVVTPGVYHAYFSFLHIWLLASFDSLLLPLLAAFAPVLPRVCTSPFVRPIFSDPSRPPRLYICLVRRLLVPPSPSHSDLFQCRFPAVITAGLRPRPDRHFLFLGCLQRRFVLAAHGWSKCALSPHQRGPAFFCPPHPIYVF